jgi:glycosyltransferase involved in cell wall biosynthesis
VGLKPGDRFLIYVGGLSPHKNLIRLVEAFALATAEHPEVRLVLVGDFQDVFHTHVPEIREAIGRLGLGDRVLLPGFVADDDLVFLYNNAYCLVQPSRMEGFGLPVVEAMACGTPVVVSTAGSLPEVAGEAGLFFDPTDTQAIANAIQTILNDPVQRDQLAQLALTRATLFSWSAAAQSLLACLEDVSGATERKQAARAAS